MEDLQLEPGRNGLFQMQVVMANEYCFGAHTELEIMSAHAEEAQQNKLENARMYLGLALAARHIALSGGGGAPSPDAPRDRQDSVV
jgi:hypothetical protein